MASLASKAAFWFNKASPLNVEKDHTANDKFA
jgi:hypothetical protein